MEANFIIRKAKIEDLDDILRLNFELFKKEQKEYDPDLNLDWTRSQGKAIFKGCIEGNDSFVCVAEEDNKIVAYLCGSLYKDGQMDWVNGKGAELNNMFVDGGFRNKGIGKKLAAAFIDWCREKEVDYIPVRASAENRNGLKFYKSFGFNDYDVILKLKLNNNK
jgi:GNAT superfamily N-acetyltransferase